MEKYPGLVISEEQYRTIMTSFGPMYVSYVCPICHYKSRVCELCPNCEQLILSRRVSPRRCRPASCHEQYWFDEKIMNGFGGIDHAYRVCALVAGASYVIGLPGHSKGYEKNVAGSE